MKVLVPVKQKLNNNIVYIIIASMERNVNISAVLCGVYCALGYFYVQAERPIPTLMPEEIPVVRIVFIWDQSSAANDCKVNSFLLYIVRE